MVRIGDFGWITVNSCAACPCKLTILAASPLSSSGEARTTLNIYNVSGVAGEGKDGGIENGCGGAWIGNASPSCKITICAARPLSSSGIALRAFDIDYGAGCSCN